MNIILFRVRIYKMKMLDHQQRFLLGFSKFTNFKASNSGSTEAAGLDSIMQHLLDIYFGCICSFYIQTISSFIDTFAKTMNFSHAGKIKFFHTSWPTNEAVFLMLGCV